MASKLRGGKLPPLLLENLTLYNPQRIHNLQTLQQSFHNILTELEPQFDGSTPPRKVPKSSCRHKWILKPRQSTLLELDDSSGSYKVSALCKECRWHVELEIQYGLEDFCSTLCPGPGFPLHHFRCSHTEECGFSQTNPEDVSSGWLDTRLFQCSNPPCFARLFVRMRSPRLKDEWARLLVDKTLIKARAEKAMAAEPGRFEGHAVPSPSEVLTNLRSYISNAMTSPEPRRILRNNKKWLLCLGDSCAELLHYMGFRRTDLEWTPPCPDVSNPTPFTNSVNQLLDDIDQELLLLLNQQPANEQMMPKASIQNTSAFAEFERLLGSKDYHKSLASRSMEPTQEEDHPFYAGLGTKLDFHDELIVFAYERQIESDADNAPYYLECLQGIAKGRDSEELQTKAAIEASSGKISLADVRDAYRSFGLEFPGAGYDDDTIVGNFQSRVADAPRQEPELRRALSIIGRHRQSTVIQHVASNTVTTYEQALSWLNATEDMDDGFLLSMFGVKVGENPDNEDLARQCMVLIAEKRKSNALKAWLETGQLGEVEMDFGQAYMRLNIQDRTIDDELVLSSYNSMLQDAPSQSKELKKALAAIAKSRNSLYLLTSLASEEHERDPSKWPVGLENIGNTCYLNSLLQFYFTVKPLRDLVLNFDEYKVDLGDSMLNKKQVGSRNVSRKEIERAQRFVMELRKLFHSMISVPNSTVTPEQELARLTLISSSTEENIRRNSILSPQRPSLSDIGVSPSQEPRLPSASSADNVDIVMVNGPGSSIEPRADLSSHTNDEVSSEETLVEVPTVNSTEDDDLMIIDHGEQQQRQENILQNKENLAPSKADDPRPSAPEHPLLPLAESSPSRANEQAQNGSSASASVKVLEIDTGTSKAVTSPPRPPNRPPPVPPRQKPEEQKRALQEEVEFGAQQDVTEVIANVLFQLQCAIKPESIDESGEQIDQIKRLFFGKQKSYTTNERGEKRWKEEFFSDIKVDVASGPRDIYAALDGAFDEQEVEVNGSIEPQYATISLLPPVLQILVQRAQFDPARKISFKSINHLEMRETIYMDRYVDSTDPELEQRRKTCWDWKKQVAALEGRRKELTTTEIEIAMPEVLQSTAKYLKECLRDDAEDPVEVRPELIERLEEASHSAKEDLSELDKEIKTLYENINSQFVDLRNLPYRLHSVFIHRGLVSAGHYWIYIYDFANSMWLKYNDGYVTEVTDANVIFEAEQSTRPATPYFLVYVRDELKSDLVNSVFRSIEPIHATQGDTKMTEAEDEEGTAALGQWSQDL